MKILNSSFKKLTRLYRNDVNPRQLFATSSCFNSSPPVNNPNEYRELLHSRTNLTTSYASSFSEFPMVTSTVRDLLSAKAENFSDKVGYAFPFQRKNLTWSELKERVDTAAQNLLNLGFVKGDRIAMALPNSVELLVLAFAAQELGIIATLLNPANQLTEFEYMLKKTEAKGLVIYDSFKILQHMKLVQTICPEIDSCAPGELMSKALPSLKHVIVLNSPLSPEKKTYKGTWTFDEISEKKSTSQQRQLPYLELDDPSLIFFTSGTTGKPKGALLSQGNILNSPYLTTVSVEKTSGLRTPCSAVPFFHIYGYSVGIIVPLFFDSTNVFPFYFPDTEWTMKSIEAYRCNTLRGVPTQFIDLLNHPNRKKYDLSSLKNMLIAGSTVSPDLLKQTIDELQLEDIVVAYGMTETSSGHSISTIACKTKGTKYAYESCGRTIPYAESKIIDPETGHILPLDTDGELCVRGPHIFQEYWDEPEKTKEEKDKNGWLKTGDTFSMDKDGYLFFKSRSKDIIIRGGANIYPAEVEAFLMTHPEIVAVQAFGVPDKRVGEEVGVWVKLKPDSTLDADGIKNFCKGAISHFKIPRYIKFVDSFPMNASQKVLTYKMREMATADFNLG